LGPIFAGLLGFIFFVIFAAIYTLLQQQAILSRCPEQRSPKVQLAWIAHQG